MPDQEQPREITPFADRLSALFDACRKHRRGTVHLLENACMNELCECEDECRTSAHDVCVECYRIAEEINDEFVFDVVMAGSCAILLAVEALEPSDG